MLTISGSKLYSWFTFPSFYTTTLFGAQVDQCFHLKSPTVLLTAQHQQYLTASASKDPNIQPVASNMTSG